MKRCCVIVVLLFCLRVFAAEVIPPAPAQYFNDYAHVISPTTASRLNSTLQDFERQSSDQILVAIFPKMQSDSSIEDYTVRVARAWDVGQKGENNGAVLFIFVQDHAMFLEVGYGLEGVLPDALCKRIIDQEISPRFHDGDFDGGVTAGVQAILAAVKGEYQGTGQTVAERRSEHSFAASQRHREDIRDLLWLIIIIAFIVISVSNRGRWGGGGGGMIFTGGGWGGFSGGGGGGGGFSGGGFSGGGFSGGGGSFGGGGAGGSW